MDTVDDILLAGLCPGLSCVRGMIAGFNVECLASESQPSPAYRMPDILSRRQRRPKGGSYSLSTTRLWPVIAPATGPNTRRAEFRRHRLTVAFTLGVGWIVYNSGSQPVGRESRPHVGSPLISIGVAIGCQIFLIIHAQLHIHNVRSCFCQKLNYVKYSPSNPWFN